MGLLQWRVRPRVPLFTWVHADGQEETLDDTTSFSGDLGDEEILALARQRQQARNALAGQQWATQGLPGVGHVVQGGQFVGIIGRLQTTPRPRGLWQDMMAALGGITNGR